MEIDFFYLIACWSGSTISHRGFPGILPEPMPVVTDIMVLLDFPVVYNILFFSVLQCTRILHGFINN